MTTNSTDLLQERARTVRLHGLLARWSEVQSEPWLGSVLQWEEEERTRRSLERRIRAARLGSFKPLADFEWDWPTRCDRAAVEEPVSLEFVKEKSNAVFIGPNGVGKSTLALNVAYQALVHGYTALFTTGSKMLGDLAAADSDAALRRRLRYYASPALFVVDEVGYVAY